VVGVLRIWKFLAAPLVRLKNFIEISVCIAVSMLFLWFSARLPGL